VFDKEMQLLSYRERRTLLFSPNASSSEAAGSCWREEKVLTSKQIESWDYFQIFHSSEGRLYLALKVLLSGERNIRSLVSPKKEFRGRHTEELLIEQIYLSKS
jgi:hypothetical protein